MVAHSDSTCTIVPRGRDPSTVVTISEDTIVSPATTTVVAHIQAHRRRVGLHVATPFAVDSALPAIVVAESQLERESFESSTRVGAVDVAVAAVQGQWQAQLDHASI